MKDHKPSELALLDSLVCKVKEPLINPKTATTESLTELRDQLAAELELMDQIGHLDTGVLLGAHNCLC